MMKISYVTTYDAHDVLRWSGTGYYMSQMLENQNVDVEYLGNLGDSIMPLLKVKAKVIKHWSGKLYVPYYEKYIQKQYIKQINSRLNPGTDIIFSPGTSPIAYLKTNIPKVFYTDACFAGIVGFYKEFSNLTKQSIKQGNQLEQEALNTCSLGIYSSDWAAKTAIENYGIDPVKIKVVPFGANISTNRNLEDIKAIINNRSDDSLNLLFLGVDWVRKGGDWALAVAEKLNRDGLKTTLHIAGIRKLPFSILPDFVVNHGFISKRTKEGNLKIEQLIANCHFLIVPSRAEAFGMVFAEANSYGVPCLTNNVGGLSTVIKNDLNGKLFSPGTDVAEWTQFIMDYFNNKTMYRELCLSSYNEFQSRLNWDVAGKTIIKLLKDL